MALRMAFREEKVGKMAEEMAETVMAKTADDGGNGSVLGKGARVRLLTLPGQAWSQRVGEELKWYDRFSVYYLPLDLNNRSLARAYALYSGKAQGAAPPDWYKELRKNDWIERADAYDIARSQQRREMLDSIGEEIEDEIKESLLLGLRAAVARIEKIGEDGVADLDVKTAMSAIPRLAKELQDIYGVGKKAGSAKHVEEILALLPLGIQQKVMIIIDQRQQAQLPANTRGEIIDGEVRELEPARVSRAKKSKQSKQI